jgi:serine-type D-Ala-D-Ala carboxypeptidase (penicillin-binding protein 5/6)
MPDVQLNAVTGEQFIINDLYYSLMLESHNDSAVIIAENTAYYLLCKNPSLRSETPFINNYNYDSSVLSEINHEQSEILVHIFTGLMNEKADDILLSDTYYITPNGLDAEDNYSFHHTTAYDLAKTMAYCINNEDFLYITQTVSKTFSDTTGRYHYQLNNKNRILNPDEGIISGKTGFTNKAGYCYVCAYKDKDRTLCIALLACGWPPNKNYKWSDARYLIALGKQYSRQKYFNNEYTFYVPVSKGKNSFCELIPDCSIEFLVCEDDSVTIRADIPEVLSAPVNSSQIYGAINIYVNNEPIRSISLKANQSIPKKVHVLDIINKIFQ